MDMKCFFVMYYYFMSESSRVKFNLIFRDLFRFVRGFIGVEVFFLKRFRGLVWVVDCSVGDVWFGGFETGGVKMFDVSKFFVGD